MLDDSSSTDVSEHRKHIIIRHKIVSVNAMWIKEAIRKCEECHFKEENHTPAYAFNDNKQSLRHKITSYCIDYKEKYHNN